MGVSIEGHPMTEIEEIKLKFDAGKLDPLKVDLERFLVAHREEIRGYRSELERKGLRLNDEAAVKFYILRRRSINPRRDITEQLEEIQKEKWIWGSRTGQSPDSQEVARDWMRRYSAGWRSHRVTSIIYVFDREKERYLKLLASASPG